MPSSTRPADAVRRRVPGGLLLFASAQDEPRARRPTDVALALVSVLLVVVTAVIAIIGGDLDAALGDLVATFPGFFDPLWLVMFWAPVVWVVVLLVASLVQRRRGLPRDLIAATAVSIVIAALVGAIAGDGAWAAVSAFADVDGPPSFPPGALTLSATVIATASPHVSLPFRHFGRWLIALQFVGALLLGATTASGGVIAVAIGLLAASIIHMIVGSPGGRPTASRIRLALDGLGVSVDELAPAAMHDRGTFQFDGHDAEGPLSIKVYGRDAWDAQLLANLWQVAWYRDTQRTARLSRLELVEHEGFVTLLAERAGVRVPHLVTAGSAGRGDALVVVRPDGTPLRDSASDPSNAGLDSLWVDLRRLHDAGISHGEVDLDRAVGRDDGTIGFGDLSPASVAGAPADMLQDRAQAFGLTLLLAGEDRATAAARRALGDEELLKVLPYVQEAAMAPQVRDALRKQDVELDDVRGRLRTALGAPDQPLIRLRRVTWGSVFNLALLAIAAYALIAAFGDVDMDEFLDALRDANWWWLAFALVLAQLPRIPSAVSTKGSLQHPLPIGPLTALQFAICYVNLAIPSTAARVAINVRFFQRFGVRPATAMSAGVIDSVAGFVVQITIFLLLFFATDVDLGLTTDTDSLSGLATVALIVLIGLVVVGIVVALVAPVRRRLVDAAHQAATALRVLRSPMKLLQLFGGNILSQVLFAVAFAACVRAFGQSLPLTELLLINTVVSLFAGLLPIPGGIGVSEAGLTLGLTTAGVPSETAFAIALAYRMCSFYFPPVWGWFCYRWLVNKRYL